MLYLAACFVKILAPPGSPNSSGGGNDHGEDNDRESGEGLAIILYCSYYYYAFIHRP